MAARYKLKTKRGAAKRFKRTASGKWLRWRSGKRHLLTGKPSKRTRRLGRTAPVSPADTAAVHRMLPYS
jgi:large subunit ribosomal protein L35